MTLAAPIRAALVLLTLSATAAAAQGTAPTPAQTAATGRVTQTTVIMEQPRGDSPVVSTVSPGVMLPLVGQQGDWYLTDFRVGFDTRRGWVSRQSVELIGSVVPPQVPVPFPIPQQDATQQPQAPPADAGVIGEPAQYWFNGGIGVGTVGCDGCTGPTNGWSGGLAFGRTFTPRFQLGIGGSGWGRSGSDVGVGLLDLRARFYPSEVSGFFITIGGGLAIVKALGAHETGIGGIAGVGYDFPLSPNVSLTPFLNGFAVTSSLVDANVGQVGIGITIH